jgi:hypothetical protein
MRPERRVLYEKIALECSDLWSEMKSAKTAVSHSLIGFF